MWLAVANFGSVTIVFEGLGFGFVSACLRVQRIGIFRRRWLMTVSRGEVEAMIEFALVLVLLAVILLIVRQR